ncbi:MAG: hypothetical protein U5K81_03355 [Trueperaceae bacterium]|nr:hypothetical protein [Trueperaceae bacterium]
MSKDAIRAFLEQMQAQHADRIDAIDLPEGTRAYVEERVAAGDVDTLLFMLKLGYLMGLQSGFAAGVSGEGEPESGGSGPLQA